MARKLWQKLLIFAITYIIISSILAYIYREDENLLTKTEVIEFQGKEITLNVHYELEDEILASETMILAKSTYAKLAEGYDKGVPHKNIAIFLTQAEKVDNYPFELEHDSNSINISEYYGNNPVVWGLAQMWLRKGNTRIPEWVIWGQSAFYSYWAMKEEGFDEKAIIFKNTLIANGEILQDAFSLDSFNLPNNFNDDRNKVNYFFAKSFTTYLNLYESTSIEKLADINNGVFSSQNYEWDSERYVTYIQDKTEIDISDTFSTVFEGNVQGEISKWKLLYRLEIILSVALLLLILACSYWDKVKKKISQIALLNGTSKIKRELIKRYGSKERILFELEAYFKKHIPDDEYDSLLKEFYNEKYIKNKI